HEGFSPEDCMSRVCSFELSRPFGTLRAFGHSNPALKGWAIVASPFGRRTERFVFRNPSAICPWTGTPKGQNHKVRTLTVLRSLSLVDVLPFRFTARLRS